jgi:hypothetical protein
VQSVGGSEIEETNMRENVVVGIYAANLERVKNNTPRLLATVTMDIEVDALMRDRKWKQQIFDACEKHLAGRRVVNVNVIRTGPDGCNVAVTVSSPMPMRAPATRKSTVSVNGHPVAKPTAPTIAALRRQGKR